jgi:hypothetical protein
MTVSVYINSEDWNGNSGSYLAWRQYSAFARAAATITTGTITDEASATALGAFAGMTASVGQFSELATEAWNDPSIIPGIISMVAVLSVNKEAQAIFLASLPIAIDQMEENENPYSKDAYPMLHDSYATAWKLSYAGSNIALFMAGSEALSTAKTSAQLGTIFQDSSILNKIEKFKSYFAEPGSFGVEGEMKAALADGAVSAGLSDSEAADIIAQETTMSKRIEAVEFWEKLSPQERLALSDHLDIADNLLEGMTPADAANKIGMYSFTLDKIWSLEDLYGVQADSMESLKANLAKACVEDRLSTTQAEGIVINLKKLDGANGLNSVVKILKDGHTQSNFNGPAFQLERGFS